MVYVTGDTHGEAHRLEMIEKENHLQAGDTVIVCGDFGYVKAELAAYLDELETRPYTICFVDGNHENFSLIYSVPEKEWCGGHVHEIRRNVLHLMRGYCFTIEGHTSFAMGGAASEPSDKVDRMLTEHKGGPKNWWAEEIPSAEEMRRASATLRERENKVDYILSHNAPRELLLKKRGRDVSWDKDRELTGFFDWMLYEVSFTAWFTGHWHDDMELTEDAMRTTGLFDRLRADQQPQTEGKRVGRVFLLYFNVVPIEPA